MYTSQKRSSENIVRQALNIRPFTFRTQVHILLLPYGKLLFISFSRTERNILHNSWTSVLFNIYWSLMDISFIISQRLPGATSIECWFFFDTDVTDPKPIGLTVGVDASCVRTVKYTLRMVLSSTRIRVHLTGVERESLLWETRQVAEYRNTRVSGFDHKFLLVLQRSTMTYSCD
jgi:hypothetical protein